MATERPHVIVHVNDTCYRADIGACRGAGAPACISTRVMRRQVGVRTVWAKTRQILFWWWIWGALAVVFLIYDNWGWAIGTGLASVFTFLAWPREIPPRVGLDHEFAVDDKEFLTTMAGATGVPFFEGNALEILNNGDALLPRDAQGGCRG